MEEQAKLDSYRRSRTTSMNSAGYRRPSVRPSQNLDSGKNNFLNDAVASVNMDMVKLQGDLNVQFYFFQICSLLDFRKFLKNVFFCSMKRSF